MSDVAHSSHAQGSVPIWTLPEIRRAPAAFRTVARLAAKHGPP